MSTARRLLVVAERSDELTWKSLRNLTAVHLLEPGQLNTYDVLRSDDIVFTQGALEAFLAGPATGKSAKAVATSAEVEDVADDEVEETELDASAVDEDEVEQDAIEVEQDEVEQDEEDA